MRGNENILRLELIGCTFVWCSAVFYSIYCFARSSQKYFKNYSDEYNDFASGWDMLLSNKRDVADYEWNTIKFLTDKLYLWVIIFIGVSELLRKLNLFRVLKLWQILLTVIVLQREMGTIVLMIILFQPLTFLIISMLQSKIAIWMCNGALLILISVYKYLIGLEELLVLFKLNTRTAYISILVIFWMNLRCVSFCLDVLDKKVDKFKFLDYLAYCFYLPIVFCGPFILYEDFKASHQNNTESLLARLLRICFDLSRYLFWMIFTEFWLHFIYVNAASFHPEWVETMDSWSLYGYGYTMGQFFHLKYVVIYGLSTSVAKFENIKVPALPVCIGRIHLYSDMWKYFDTGLYNFLVRYIYLPSLNSKVIQSRMISSLFCFIFVYIWHGTDHYILIWTIMNYSGLLIENVVKTVSQRYLKISNMDAKWLRRISCMFAAPLLALSAISNFYFFGRSQIGNIFLFRFLSDDLGTNVTLLFILYCCCQVSTELRTRRKNIKRSKEKD